MKLIGAGLPRTATLSQKVALEQLGLAPCYHMVNVLTDLSLADEWIELFRGGGDLRRTFSSFRATVDWPGAFFYRELMEAYPEAKVLLSVRDADAWERSMTDTIWGVFYGDSLMHDLSSAQARVNPAWARYIDLMKAMWQKSGLLAGDINEGPGAMGKAMRRYNDEVRATVPSDRLLVWSVTDGWEPLCEFLGLDLPDTPFPRVNDSSEFVTRIVDASLAVLDRWHHDQAGASEPQPHP